MSRPEPTERKVSRRWPVISGSAAIALLAVLAALIFFRPRAPFALDQEWLAELVEHRSPFWDAPALFMNSLGGGVIGVIIVPAVTVAILLLFRRPWAAAYYAITVAVSAALVQLLKIFVARARPSDMLVPSDFGSFPSGHVANAATIAVVLALVFPTVWVWIAGGCYTIIMMLSRTYLGVHWLSDTIGGLLLGAGIAVIIWAPVASRLLDERRRPHRLVGLR